VISDLNRLQKIREGWFSSNGNSWSAWLFTTWIHVAIV
jgi:hypothetical protein